MIEYFCVGSTLCIRKAQVMCNICFRMVCYKHMYRNSHEAISYCNKCKKDIDNNPFIPGNLK